MAAESLPPRRTPKADILQMLQDTRTAQLATARNGGLARSYEAAARGSRVPAAGDESPPTPPFLRVAAPMVRYSKLPFRELVRDYHVDIAYTPMILADVFRNSNYARDTDFTTSTTDSPLVVQFAASKPEDLAHAAEIVQPFVDAVDLNCGCPQRWAIGEGIGAHLMSKPELVRDMVRQTKARVTDVPCSIKIRIHKDVRETVEFVKRAESAGIDFITVHGRRRWQKSTVPVDVDAIRLVRENASVPIIANGGVFSLTEANDFARDTGVVGVMAARGLLENPAMFRGDAVTPWECVEKFVKLSIGYGSNHFIFHHHLMYMMEHLLSPAEKKTFNVLSSSPAVLDYLEEFCGLKFH